MKIYAIARTVGAMGELDIYGLYLTSSAARKALKAIGGTWYSVVEMDVEQ